MDHDHCPWFIAKPSTPDAGFGPELIAKSQGILSRLKPRQREVLHLAFVESLKGYEIAERLGVSQAMVSRYMHTGLARIRRLMHIAAPVKQMSKAAVKRRRSAYYRHHRERLIAAARRWNAEHREYVREKARERRLQKAS